jgi:undecaprenyl diphosphate synthase
MKSYKEKINLGKLPKHIAIIMDGNGRWALKNGLNRVDGHFEGVDSVREIAEAAASIGIKYITLYTFSTENWSRPKQEVDALMSLFIETIVKELDTLNKNDIRLNAIGALESLPEKNYKQLIETMKETSSNSTMTLTLAMSYSSRWEIINAVKNIALEVESGKLKSKDISEDIFENYLTTVGIPDPELLIRTSGELRISNYLLWQIAYSELYFTDVLWPDFRKEELYKAIVEYQDRERRFGLTSEQLIS